MGRTKTLAGSLLVGLSLAGTAVAQPSPPRSPDMTFFVTSGGLDRGGDLGGIEGADAHCQRLGASAGAGDKRWRAYLSTQAVDGATAVHARDRIGRGPWQNFRGEVVARDIGDLHSDNSKLGPQASLTERGTMIPTFGFSPNYHDILTGSQADGTAFPSDQDRTCRNWRSSSAGAAMVGHLDRRGLRDDAASRSWNASHPTRGCSASDLLSTGGNGLLYCFAER